MKLSPALSASEVSDLYNIDVDGDGYAAWEDCDDNDASWFVNE